MHFAEKIVSVFKKTTPQRARADASKETQAALSHFPVAAPGETSPRFLPREGKWLTSMRAALM